MAQTPPCHLPNIPGVTSPGTLIEDSKVEVNNLNNLNNHDRKHTVGKRMPVLGTKGVALGIWMLSAVGWKNVDASLISDVQLYVSKIPPPPPPTSLTKVYWNILDALSSKS